MTQVGCTIGHSIWSFWTFSGMELFTFHGDDFHISRNGVTQIKNEARRETSTHTQVAAQTFTGMAKSELLWYDLLHLGDDLGHGLEHFAH